MKKIYNSKIDREVMLINPGEYYTSAEDVICTILGSCVSVVLYSNKKHIGGINHFMLPASSEIVFLENSFPGRYGVYAMELLINSLMKRSVEKRELIAKVFGGGNVLYTDSSVKYHIGLKNTEFVFKFLAAENIPVIARDTGEDYGRKIYFFPETGKVLVRKIIKSTNLLMLYEKKYMDNIVKENIENNSKIILFNDDQK